MRRFVNSKVAKPYPLFFIEWIIRREPLMLIGTMLFGSAVLFGILKLYTTDIYDFRLLGIGLVIVAGTQVQLIYLAHQFDNFHFTLLRQLPIPHWKRIGTTVITHALLILPLLGVLIRYFPPNLSSFAIAEGVIFLIGSLIFWNGFYYQKDRDMEDVVRIVFAVSIGMLVLVLFKVPLFVLALINIALGIYWWTKYYYKFEYVSR